MNRFEIGRVVRNINSGEYGTVEYSTFGYSIHLWVEDEGRMIFGKTVGDSEKNLRKHWRLSDLPEGYRIHEYGGVVKVE